MPELIAEKTVTARKVHRCMTCGSPAVQPGEQYTRTTWVYDGQIYDWVQCSPCGAIFSVIYEWAWGGDDGIDEVHYRDWANEHSDDPEHGEAARAYLARTEEAVSDRER